MEINIQSVVEHVPAMLYVYAVNHENGESSFPFVSDFCEEMFGFSASEVMEDPKVLVNAILEEEAEQYAAAVMESMEHLTPFDRLGRMRRADGRIINVHYKSRPRFVEETNELDGKVTKYTIWDGIVFDVTRQVSNEESNRTKLQEMMDQTVQPVFEIDTNGRIIEWNTPMARLTDYSRTEALGQPFVAFLPEDERASFASLVSSSCDTKDGSNMDQDDVEKPLLYDCTLETKDKKRRVFLYTTCTVSHDANGSETGRLFFCQDNTMVKEAEKQKDAALKLVDAERGLTEWLSHEVRNPLSVAMEAVMAMKEGNDHNIEQDGWYIDLISESIRYIVDLLTNMLDLNKCLEGKVRLNLATCKVREEVLVPTCRMMSLHKGNVNLEFVQGNEVTGVIDKLRLRQVVTNLISNAMKFTTHGFIKVELNEEKSPLGKGIMRIVVSDSGCGVNASDYDALFSKWEVLGSKANGAGIGLCLSRALAQAMGGDVLLNKSYRSGLEDFPGAQFIVEIPLSSMLDVDATRIPAFESLSAAVVASKEENRGKLSGESPTNKPSEISDTSMSADLYVTGFSELNDRKMPALDTAIGGRFTILVIDDDNMGRKLLARRFSRLFPQSEISEVASGEEALRVVENTLFDIITVDHFMAVNELSGEETIRELRTRDVDSLVIGISGNFKKDEHLAAGAEDFFQKPIPNDEILVTRLLEKVAPPGNWKVLIVDDVKVNIHFLSRRLRKVSAPHFTSLQKAEKRWDISSRTSGEEAVELLRDEWFDLVVVDQYLGEGISGSSVARFVREHAVHRNAIVVLNSGSLMRAPEGDLPYDIFWPKPLPTTEKMRTDLCFALIESKKDAPS